MTADPLTLRLAAAAALASLIVTAPARAVITSSGLNVNAPSNAADGDSRTVGEMEIGAGSLGIGVDPRASLTVDGTSQLTAQRAYIGSDAGFFSRTTIDGFGTKMTITDDGTTSEPALQVGRDGDGQLTVSGGAWLDLTDDLGDFVLGDNDSNTDESVGIGVATVTGDLTLVTIGDDLVVGNLGYGRLDLRDGALMRTGRPNHESSNDLVIGSAAGSTGEMYVDGAETRLIVGDNLTVGSLGVALMVISGDAIVDADSFTDSVATVGVEGRLRLAGGRLFVDQMQVTGVLEGSGWISGADVLNVNSAGRVAVGSGDLLRVDKAVTNSGDFLIEGGEAELLEAFTNVAPGGGAPNGSVTLDAGVARFSEGLTNNGVVAATAGASDLFGAVTNNTSATVLVARDAVLTLHDAFTDTGGTVQVLAGGNALFLGDATFQASSTLSIELDTDPESAGGAAIDVAGVATLGGTLEVSVPGDYVPTLGETFSLLQAGGGVSGAFDLTDLPDIGGGLEFGVLTSGAELLLEVRIETVTTLEGDYNGDGVVDAADYTAWRDGDVPTTQENYDAWAGNLGATAPPSVSVPEPTTVGLVLVGLFSAGWRARGVPTRSNDRAAGRLP